MSLIGTTVIFALVLIWYFYIKPRVNIDYIIIHYRWVLVFTCIIPASLVYNAFLYMRSYIVFYLTSDPGKHKERVRKVQHQVREWVRQGRPNGHMCTARPGWMTMSFRIGKYKDVMRRVEINLVDILHLDVEKEVIRVEPLCTIGQISALITPLGWGLPVTPELDDLTIGGMINGFGIESSSHIYGLLQHCVVSMEVVMADGSVVTCSAEENSDLFYSIPMSHGTIGFLVSAEIKIIPIKPYLRLDYHPCQGLDKICWEFEKASRNKENHFVECLMYDLDSAVVMTGKMTNQLEPGKLNRIGNFYKPWFYKHVQNFLTSNCNGYDYIPIRDYYHRHSKSLFWEMEEIVPFGNNPVFRYLLGWTMPPKVSFLKLTQMEAVKRLYEEKHMDQDLLVPIGNLKKTLKSFDDWVKIYPIWLCPFILPYQRGFLHPPTVESDNMYVDIGVYGSPPPVVIYKPKETTRQIEEHVRKVNGYQMLYADCYQTREEFRSMFDHSLYDEVRKEKKSDKGFPDIYDKVCKNARY